jgi:hypothetical protein
VNSVADPKTLARLVQRLEVLRPDTPRRWGTLTAGEMLCHLGDAATNLLGRPPSGEARTHRLRKWVGLRSPLPWPRGARTPPRLDPRLEGTRPTDFEQDRRRAIESLRQLALAPDEVLRATHALFGRMTPDDWKRWAYRHTDHHLRQFGM